MDKELIEKYAPGADCIEPMKIWKIPEGKEHMFGELAESGDYFAQLKKDGYWYQYEKTSDGEHSYLFSRTVSRTTGILTEKLNNVPHIAVALCNVPNGTTLIGEIYYPGKTSKNVTTIMGCLPQKAIDRQVEQGKIHYYIHDIIKYKSESLINKGAWERYQILKECWEDSGLGNYSFLELAQSFEDNLQERAMKALDDGEEGMVFKKKDAPYSPGKRPAWQTFKIKKIDYLDAVCIGFCDATKEYTGIEIETWGYWVRDDDGKRVQGCYYGQKGYTPVTKGYFFGWKTAIAIAAYNEETKRFEQIGTIASGLTDELRKDFAENPEDYLGQVVSLQCMEIDKKEHTCRHGFFKGFRYDKDATDCTISSIFGE